MLRAKLPRPDADATFAEALLSQILAGDGPGLVGLGDDGEWEWRRRLVYVGGALAGAAALLLGWRWHRTPRGAGQDAA